MQPPTLDEQIFAVLTDLQLVKIKKTRGISDPKDALRYHLLETLHSTAKQFLTPEELQQRTRTLDSTFNYLLEKLQNEGLIKFSHNKIELTLDGKNLSDHEFKLPTSLTEDLQLLPDELKARLLLAMKTTLEGHQVMGEIQEDFFCQFCRYIMPHDDGSQICTLTRLHLSPSTT